MALSITNPVYLHGAVPTKSGQVVASSVGGARARELVCTFTITLDGAATTGAVNYIDGTETLGFTPSAILIGRVGGSAAVTVQPYCSAISGTTTFTVGVAAAGTNTNTVLCVAIIIPA